jgi:8-oxo-dGTP pyrophosphatase MutT (NUDIX family)
MEETGLINLHLAHPTLFDIDIHTIPAKNNVPEHDHYDIRYWFLADFNQTPITNHARKEAMEETGLINLHLAHPTLFDIDIHTIPAKNNVPEHDHYDIRYWFLADFNQTPITNHESNEVKWVNLSEAKKLAEGNKSLMRMIQKTEQHEFIS